MHQPFEILACRPVARLDGNTLQHRLEQVGQSADINLRGKIALSLGTLKTLDERLMDDPAALHHFAADRLSFFAAGNRRDDSKTAVGLVAAGDILNRPAEH